MPISDDKVEYIYKLPNGYNGASGRAKLLAANARMVDGSTTRLLAHQIVDNEQRVLSLDGEPEDVLIIKKEGIALSPADIQSIIDAPNPT